MPLNIDFLQVLLHLLNFVILAGGLTFLVYRPVLRFIDERRERIEKAEKKNAENAKENEALRAEYEEKLSAAGKEAAELSERAGKEAAAAAAETIRRAEEKAADIIRVAEAEAEERKTHILDSAQTEIGELVVSATQKLLSGTVTPERNTALSDEFVRLADTAVKAEREHN